MIRIRHKDEQRFPNSAIPAPDCINVSRPALLELLKEDNRAIFTASSKASQAADYLRAFSEPEEAEDVGEH